MDLRDGESLRARHVPQDINQKFLDLDLVKFVKVFRCNISKVWITKFFKFFSCWMWHLKYPINYPKIVIGHNNVSNLCLLTWRELVVEYSSSFGSFPTKSATAKEFWPDSLLNPEFLYAPICSGRFYPGQHILGS